MMILRSILSKISAFMCSALGLAVCACDSETLVTKKVEETLCMYGMPENYGSMSGTVYGNTGGEKKPLPNVKIYGTGKGLETSLEDGSLFKTGEDGRYFIDIFDGGEYTFTFKDGDGEENGLYETLEVKVDHESGMADERDVTLEIDGTKEAENGENKE
jgi:hypothetical protein